MEGAVPQADVPPYFYFFNHKVMGGTRGGAGCGGWSGWALGCVSAVEDSETAGQDGMKLRCGSRCVSCAVLCVCECVCEYV